MGISIKASKCVPHRKYQQHSDIIFISLLLVKSYSKRYLFSACLFIKLEHVQAWTPHQKSPDEQKAETEFMQSIPTCMLLCSTVVGIDQSCLCSL